MTFELLAKNIEGIQAALQEQAAHAVNLSLTARNWLMGCYIVEFEQNGEDRAQYGAKLLKRLEERLQTKGLTERRFREFRRLYLVYPQLGKEVLNYVGAQSYATIALPEEIRRTSSAESNDTAIRRLATAESENAIIRRLTTAELAKQEWLVPADRLFYRIPTTHLIELSKIEDPIKRAFYEIETIKGCWTITELDRQISTLYYERSGLSKDKEGLSKLVNQTTNALAPKDVLHNPVALEFLDLEQNEKTDETDLETAILDKLQNMLLELGNGFCISVSLIILRLICYANFGNKRRRVIADYFFIKNGVVYFKYLCQLCKVQ